MTIKLSKLTLLITTIILVMSCNSVEKYNAQIAKKHSPKELKEDVDYAYEKLQKLHPNLYQYISKEKLEANFDNLKQSLVKPLSSLEFYTKIAPVIASIGQGHTSLGSPHKKQSKKDIKKRGKRKALFKNFRFTTLNDKIYVDRAFGKDSLTSRGSELLKVDGIPVDKLIETYQSIGTGDGYVKTFMPKFTRQRIGSFYYLTNPIKDSIQITLKNKDSVFSKYLYAFAKKKKTTKIEIAKAKTKKDSIKLAKKSLTKAAKKTAKKKKKILQDHNWNYGYDKFTKEYVRNIDFIDAPNKKKVALMKIRGFMKGSYEEFYDDVFKQIDSLKVTDLVIDLRNNTGGRLSEIAYLYSYLTDKEHQFIMPAKMTKANSFMYPMMHRGSVLSKAITFPIAKVIQLLKVKKINGKPHFVFSSAKKREPKTEHNYKGKVYVMINAVSFSASAVLSNKLKATKRAYFVGEETGGAYNSTVAGIFAPIELPNSKEVVRVGLMVLETPHKITPDGYGVKPDKYIKTTSLDKDEQLDWILNDIAK